MNPNITRALSAFRTVRAIPHSALIPILANAAHLDLAPTTPLPFLLRLTLRALSIRATPRPFYRAPRYRLTGFKRSILDPHHAARVALFTALLCRTPFLLP